MSNTVIFFVITRIFCAATVRYVRLTNGVFFDGQLEHDRYKKLNEIKIFIPGDDNNHENQNFP